MDLKPPYDKENLDIFSWNFRYFDKKIYLIVQHQFANAEF